MSELLLAMDLSKTDVPNAHADGGKRGGKR